MPSTYITGEFIRSLMPAFACCESYTERLLFWEQHGLTETLSYAVDKDNRLINKREDIKALCSVLSLAPYTIEEAKQFTTWALRVRPGMNKKIGTFEAKRDAFLQMYNGAGLEDDKRIFVESVRGQMGGVLNGNFESYGITKSAAETIFQIDLSRLPQISLDIRYRPDSTFLANLVFSKTHNNKPLWIDWQIIDTYLFVKATHEMADFLEHFTPPKKSKTSQNKKGQGLKTPDNILNIEDKSMRDRLIKAIRTHVEEYDYDELTNALSGNAASKKIVVRCQSNELGYFFHQAKLRNSSAVARWICDTFKGTDGNLSYDTIYDSVRGKEKPADKKNLKI